MTRDQIYPRLWQGSAPGERVPFDVLVLCAEEWQPTSKTFPGTLVVHAPFDDTPDLSRPLLLTATKAARLVEQALRERKQVLVTCMAGRNRSGLVSALALCMLTGADGRRVVRQIQSRRANALTNASFREFVEQIPAQRRRSRTLASP